MKKRLEILVQSAQHIGDRREQQDIIKVADDLGEACLAVLADGMGGMLMGRECAELAANAFIESYAARTGGNVVENLNFSAQRANELVFSMAEAYGAAEMAGCTLLVAVVSERKLHWLSIGDSHLYLFREGSLRQLNTDHNLRAKLLKAQKYSEGHDVVGDVNLSALTSFIGISSLSEIDVSSEPVVLAADDVVLLCSDGLYNTLRDDEIGAVLSSCGKNKAVPLLKEVLARAKEHQDNVSLIILSVADHKGGYGANDGRTVLIGKEPGGDAFFHKFLRFFRMLK